MPRPQLHPADYARSDRPARLLRRPRRLEDGHGRRDQEGVPPARARAPPGPQRGRRRRRGALQGGRRGLLRPLGRRQARALRPLRPPGRRTAPAGRARRRTCRTSSRPSRTSSAATRRFDDVFGRARSRRRGQGRPGTDLRVRLSLSLEEVADGVERQIKLRKFTACDHCAGSGAEPGESSHGHLPDVPGLGRGAPGRVVVLRPVRQRPRRARRATARAASSRTSARSAPARAASRARRP